MDAAMSLGLGRHSIPDERLLRRSLRERAHHGQIVEFGYQGKGGLVVVHIVAVGFVHHNERVGLCAACTMRRTWSIGNTWAGGIVGVVNVDECAGVAFVAFDELVGVEGVVVFAAQIDTFEFDARKWSMSSVTAVKVGAMQTTVLPGLRHMRFSATHVPIDPHENATMLSEIGRTSAKR